MMREEPTARRWMTVGPLDIQSQFHLISPLVLLPYSSAVPNCQVFILENCWTGQNILGHDYKRKRGELRSTDLWIPHLLTSALFIFNFLFFNLWITSEWEKIIWKCPHVVETYKKSNKFKLENSVWKMLLVSGFYNF